MSVRDDVYPSAALIAESSNRYVGQRHGTFPRGGILRTNTAQYGSFGIIDITYPLQSIILVVPILSILTIPIDASILGITPGSHDVHLNLFDDVA